MASKAVGTLYVVATPIGNLEDITLRALRVLKEVALIAAEDTRHTRKLLERYGIDTPLTSFHQHTGEGKRRALIERLLQGDSIALVTDAGTPGISDPGGVLVAEAHEAGVPVVPVPGPSALTRFRACPPIGSVLRGSSRARRAPDASFSNRFATPT